MRRISPLVAVLIWLPGCSADSDGRMVCAECEVAVEQVASLDGAPAHAEPLLNSSLTQLASGTYVAGPTSDPNVLAVYTVDGRFIRLIGGQGDGPGEFRAIMDVAAKGDTLIVLSPDRITVMPHADQVVRTMTLRSPTSAHLLAINSEGAVSFATNGMFGQMRTRLWTVSDDGANQLPVGRDDLADEESVRGVSSIGDTIWTITQGLEIRGLHGAGLEIDGPTVAMPEWYVDEVARAKDQRRRPPSVNDIHVTADLVWIAFNIFGDHPSAAAGSGEGTPRQLSIDEWTAYAPSILVCFDRRTGAVLAELRPDFAVGGFTDDGRLYSVRQHDDAGNSLAIYRVELRRNQPPRRSS